MSFVFVEFEVINNDRLKTYPTSYRVVKSRTTQVAAQQLAETADGSQPTIQKLRPVAPLTADELRHLKINDKILEKYPPVVEYLEHITVPADCFYSKNILVPVGSDSTNVLLELERDAQSKLSEPVLAPTPGFVEMVTGICFSGGTSVVDMLRILREQREVDCKEDLMEGAVQFEFVDSIQLDQPTGGSLLVTEETVPPGIGIHEATVALLRTLASEWPYEFYSAVAKLSNLELNLPLNQSEPDILKMEATGFIKWRHLEQLGLRLQEVFDIRHVYPNVSLVKFYNKLDVKERLEQVTEFYQDNRIVRLQNGQEITLTARPELVDRFPQNPVWILIKDCPAAGHIGIMAAKEAINIIYGNVSTRKSCDKIKIFQNMAYQELLDGDHECLRLTVSDTTQILCFPYPSVDHDTNKRIELQLSESVLRLYDFGLVGECEINQMHEFKHLLATEQENDLTNLELSETYSGLSGEGPQSSMISQSALEYEEDSYEPPKSTIMPLERIPEYAKDCPNSAREQRLKCVGVEVLDLPHDVKVKDVAGFCKAEKVAESMAWNLHQPFNIQMGPIKIYSNYALLLFASEEAAERAVFELNKAYFKNRPIRAQISTDQQDNQFIEQCFELKDSPNFHPAYVIIMKQINLPEDSFEFADLIENTWHMPRPDYQRVRMDNGICFFKSEQEAEKFYMEMKERFFHAHVNDIFRMDLD